jgi:probable HAF family extracellular repeat protein
MAEVITMDGHHHEQPRHLHRSSHPREGGLRGAAPVSGPRFGLGFRRLPVMVVTLVALVGAMLSWASSTPAAAATDYTILGLGLPPGTNARVTDMNAAGEVVGEYHDPATVQNTGFFWSPTTGLELIGSNVAPLAINASGQVTGTRSIAVNTSRAFVWSQADGMTTLGTFGGCCSGGVAINTAGEVTGNANTATPETHAFFWSQGSGMVDLGTFGGPNSSGGDLNDAGQVIGDALGGGFTHAFIWDSVNGKQPLTPELGIASNAFEVNEAGEAAGHWYSTGGDESGGHYWSPSTGMVDIQPLSGVTHVFDLNEVGQVIGRFCDTALSIGACTDEFASYFAYVWSPADGLTEMGNPAGTRATPLSINNGGVAVGTVVDIASGAGSGFVWDSADGMRSLPGFSPGGEAFGSVINDAGVVAGVARDDTGFFRAAIWTPGSAPADSDGDGINDDVDTDPGTPSTMFLDTTTDPDTFGEIVDPAGLTVTVEDEPLDGVRVTVGPGAGEATLSVCGSTVQVAAGSIVVLTCSSLITQVISGAAVVELGDGLVAISIPAGVTAEVTENPDGSFSVQNQGGGDITVVVDGVQTVVSESDPPLQGEVWDFQGFFAPIDNPSVLNVVKAGQAVPLKWRLVRADGTPVTDLASVSLRASTLPCADGTTSDQLEETATGSSGLQNLGYGNYQFNWKTPKSYARSCKTLHLDLGEGVERTALFRFVK